MIVLDFMDLLGMIWVALIIIAVAVGLYRSRK